MAMQSGKEKHVFVPSASEKPSLRTVPSHHKLRWFLKHMDLPLSTPITSNYLQFIFRQTSVERNYKWKGVLKDIYVIHFCRNLNSKHRKPDHLDRILQISCQIVIIELSGESMVLAYTESYQKKILSKAALIEGTYSKRLFGTDSAHCALHVHVLQVSAFLFPGSYFLHKIFFL